MSASSSPTFSPSPASATARLTAVVDLPTPPLPEATATMAPTSGSSIGRGWPPCACPPCPCACPPAAGAALGAVSTTAAFCHPRLAGEQRLRRAAHRFHRRRVGAIGQQATPAPARPGHASPPPARPRRCRVRWPDRRCTQRFPQRRLAGAGCVGWGIRLKTFRSRSICSRVVASGYGPRPASCKWAFGNRRAAPVRAPVRRRQTGATRIHALE